MTGYSIIAAAETRASITAFLNKHPGLRTVAEIAEGTELRAQSAGRTLALMAQDGLIAGPYEHEGAKCYAIDTQHVAPTKSKKHRATTAKEVELVLGGLLVVVGRNEKTGRIRVTLEEQA